ncbi:DNA replication terminus site-binding protein [Vibrio metschnikovii]|uniref:DNA replication terminus site-binding protein n=1 Tax=Vibrio metschnikovii TaxID=28172 RepID=UPI0001B93C7A|nr:DNA replication terminus site-binding protein [Vibrio metschnikovii]EEX38533.1 hypothetical protein VIB_000188 [Vibrio metschnikovii CIP 69.14]SUP46625.1 DNA replication terminus site-binding protein [Vibrio metschnikovii]SUQ10583.1 DNA replication terminus site-binding protein [Vibrio metschnikovii]
MEIDLDIDIESTVMQLKDQEQELYNFLIALKLIQKHVQDVPQFQRGEALPPTIHAKRLDSMPLHEALRVSIEPQKVFEYPHNIPKRFAGLIQLEANEKEYEQAQALTHQINELRATIVNYIAEKETDYRKRARLSQRLFPDTLYQTVNRKIPLLPDTSTRIDFSWCEQQKSVKKLSTEQAVSMLQRFDANTPPWQAAKNMERLMNSASAYKVTNVRTHPQALVKYYNEETGEVFVETRKVHSPMIALIQSRQPMEVSPLPDFQENDKKHLLLKGYKPIVEGTCLYCKDSPT